MLALGTVSRRPAGVGFQEFPQALTAHNLTMVSFVPRLDDSIQAVVNPLVMVVFEILAQDMAQLFFRGEDQTVFL